MEPLHLHGAMRGSSSPGPSSRQMRQHADCSSPPREASALQPAPKSSSRSSGAAPPQASASWCTRNLKRPSFMTSPSASRWLAVGRSRTTSQSFFAWPEDVARSTQKAPSRWTSRSRGSPPAGGCSRSLRSLVTICTSVPFRTQTMDFETVKVCVSRGWASKSKRSCESRAQVLVTTWTACGGVVTVSPARAMAYQKKEPGNSAAELRNQAFA
mmetsp:Transcript_100229/g.266419  ORF Transcript_100229/g.266419 Transcript_100229/m.266419 type:complete len:213 (+) Transcript_100229:817-1455(+)